MKILLPPIHAYLSEKCKTRKSRIRCQLDLEVSELENVSVSVSDPESSPGRLGMAHSAIGNLLPVEAYFGEIVLLRHFDLQAVPSSSVEVPASVPNAPLPHDASVDHAAALARVRMSANVGKVVVVAVFEVVHHPWMPQRKGSGLLDLHDQRVRVCP